MVILIALLLLVGIIKLFLGYKIEIKAKINDYDISPEYIKAAFIIDGLLCIIGGIALSSIVI